jgi:fructan beta-fructosidase
MNNKICFIFCIIFSLAIKCTIAQDPYKEMHRPQVHFSPKANWMNDPNGMVFYKGTYHMFYQYYPDGTVWGPMHWGHATSKDMIRWDHQPIALYPDSIGYIFSGSAVVDINNTSGFGKNGKVPLVAIFTHSDPVGSKAKRNDFQTQSLAYSLDEGKTWIKYEHNPVLKNPGIVDFRDPKVMWHAPTKKWIMTLATKDRVTFYSSPDLKNWQKESEFGKEIGAHGGVWECPDLFTLNDNGKKVWVLVANLNPGGPNGGSASQYFLGEFDGHVFAPNSNETKWLDYGPDEYAGITWSNTGERKIFLGWMSNWAYATKVPTASWRSALTIPRELSIKHTADGLRVASEPVAELNKIQSMVETRKDFSITKSFDIKQKSGKELLPCKIEMKLNDLSTSFSFVLSNDLNEKTVIGYNKEKNQFYIDRTHSGKIDFERRFANAVHTAPRFTTSKNLKLTLIMDDSSVELFADDGLTVMTEIFFPNKPYAGLYLESKDKLSVKEFTHYSLKSIWK